MVIINDQKKSIKEMKVSIGLPVYNGGKFIRKKLDSLLEQRLSNFEIIISDNNSTDLTHKICKEYASKDKRIRYFQQNENIGGWKNFGFVLQKAKYEYFLWTAVDDIILPQFLEETLKILESDKKIVASTSTMKLYGKRTSELQTNTSNRWIIKKIKKISLNFGYMNMFSATGTYENRIKEYFKNIRHNQVFYSVFRTEQIKQSFVKNEALWSDACTIFNILKFGELFVIDKMLMSVYDGGQSRSGMLGVTKQNHYNVIKTIFPMSPFTKWCIQNLGSKIMIKNCGFFIKINCIGELSLIIDIIRKLIK